MFGIFLITPILIFNAIGQPLAESYPDEQGHIVYSKVYVYSSDGELEEEIEYGNLTGGNSKPVALDDSGLPKSDQTCERYSTRYSHSKNQISIKDEKGCVFNTIYRKGTTLPEAQYFYNSEVDLLQRWFYLYDSSDVLSEWISDNGIDENPNNLIGVTKRRILRFKPTSSGETIEEWHLEDSKEILKMKSVRSLVDGLEREEIFDGSGNSLGWSEKQYNELQQIKEESDSTGYKSTFTYVSPGEIIQNIGDLSIYFSQDFLRKIVCRTEEKEELSLQWEYHPNGRLAFFIDEQGNKTEYRWEGNSMIQIDPLVLDENDEPYQPTWKYTYDCFENLRSLTNPGGETTSFTYTSRGQPSIITFPDGTTEMFKYDLEGSLHRHRLRNGKIYVYEYDDFGGLQYKEMYGPSSKSPGAFLGGVRFDSEKNGLKWISRRGEESLFLTKANRNFRLLNDKKKPLLEWNSESPSKRKIWYGNDSQDFWIEEDNRIYRSTGSILCECAAPSTIQDRFCENTIDVRGRLKKQERKVKDKVLSSVEYFYDRSDNLVREKYLRTPNEGLLPHFQVGYEWGPSNQLKGSWIQNPERKVTFQYGSFGFVKKRIFEESILNYQYNQYGDLYKVYRDLQQPISIFLSEEDTQTATSSNGIEIRRDFSLFGYVESEYSTLSYASLQLQYKRDRLGRIFEITLPDRSLIRYQYDGPFVSSIQRLNVEKKELYRHTINKRTLFGHIQEETLIGLAGSRNLSWIPEKGLVSVETSSFSQAISSDYSLLKTRDPVGSFITQYGYDELSRLVEETGPFSHTFTYDSLDNCIRKDGISSEINDFNQLLSLETAACKYNPNGSLAAKNKTTFHYNSFNQPTRVELEKGDTIIYRNDSLGRWVEREVKEVEQEEDTISKYSAFLYLDRTIIGFIDENYKINALKIPLDPQCPDSSPSIAIELNGKVFAPIYNLFGDLVVLLDSNTGSVSESYRYSAFGEEALFDAQQQPISKSKLGNRWRYRDRYKDEETGLIYFGLRFYDPFLMRWITPDPIGTVDGPNLYAFLHNNPIGHHDLSGLADDSFNQYFYGDYESHCYCERHRDCKRGGSIASRLAGIAIGLNDFAITALNSCAQLGLMVSAADLDCTEQEREVILAIAEQSGFKLRENLKLGIEGIFNLEPNDEVAEKYSKSTQLALQVADFLRGNVRDPRKIIAFAKKHSLEKLGGVTKWGKHSVSTLSKAGQVLDKGGLSKAGRALDKHGNRPGSIFPKATGNPAAKNAQGQLQLDKILTNPNSKVSQWKHRTLGNVIDIEIPEHGGVRFTQNGEFIGFLEP